MIEEHFPEFYRKTDEQSLGWQQRYLWSERVQLLALLVPAAASVAWKPPLALTVVALAIATYAHLYRRSTRADEKWWNGRAGAESAKTLAWRYVVAGAPLGIHVQHAEQELADRVAELATNVAKRLAIPVSAEPVTKRMTEQRRQPLGERVKLYSTERINSQLDWYSRKSEWNADKGRQWSNAVVGAQGLALALGIASAWLDWRINPVTILAGMAAAAVAWSNVKQFEVLARSYAVASNELSVIATRIHQTDWDEKTWALFVNEAEEAISREHTSWRASRAV